MSSKGIPLAWLKGFATPEERDNFSYLLRNNRQLFTIFRNILDDMYEEIEKSETDLRNDYTETDWAYKQAHRNGRKAVLREIKELTKFIERPTND